MAGHPGVRYEARLITRYAACVTCLWPVFEAGGRWWHENGDCSGPRKIRDLPTEPLLPASPIPPSRWPPSTGEAITALDRGGLPASGEQRVLRLAASLADRAPVSLGATIAGLDGRSVGLLVRSVLHASGERQSPAWP